MSGRIESVEVEGYGTIYVEHNRATSTIDISAATLDDPADRFLLKAIPVEALKSTGDERITTLVSLIELAVQFTTASFRNRIAVIDPLPTN